MNVPFCPHYHHTVQFLESFILYSTVTIRQVTTITHATFNTKTTCGTENLTLVKIGPDYYKTNWHICLMIHVQESCRRGNTIIGVER